MTQNQALNVEKQKEMADAPSPEEATRAQCPEKHRTAGNVIYDFGIYGSTAWIGVSLFSLLAGHEALHGTSKSFDWLRSLNTKIIEGTRGLLSKKLMKNASPETIDGIARGTAMFATLGSGGSLLMAPLKWMEDNRQKNAAKIDNFLGTTPPDPETIEKEPKQTWKSVLSGRALSWGISYLAFLAMGPKVADKLSGFFGQHATNTWMKLRPQSNPVNVRKWANLGAFDVLFTAITAGVTYGFSRFVAKKRHKTLDFEDSVVALDPLAPTILSQDFVNALPEDKKYASESLKKPVNSKENIQFESHAHKLAASPRGELAHQV